MYGDTSGYGGLAGFSGPALGGGGPVEVVRFQDLHRKHAPASAGLPEVGGFAAPPATDAPMHFGDVMASPDFGGFAFGEVPSYGGADYGRELTVEDGKYEYKVETGTTPYKVTITKSPSGGTPRDVPASNNAAYDAIISKARQQYPYDFAATSSASTATATSTSSTAVAKTDAPVAETTTTKQSQRQQAEKEENDLARKARELVEGALKGIRGQQTAAELQKQQVSDVKPPADENKALTYALWAGGALLGIGAVYLIVKAVSDDDDDKKKGE